MNAPVRARLDHALTIRQANAPWRTVLGRSVYELVLPSHHDLLRSFRRSLFDQHKMVSGTIPTWDQNQTGPRWWFVRAAPICEAGRAVAAFAHALPREYVAPADWQSISASAWERELASRDLNSILRHLDSEPWSEVGARPCAPSFEQEPVPRGP